MSRGLRAFAFVSGIGLAASMAIISPVGGVDGHDRTGG